MWVRDKRTHKRCKETCKGTARVWNKPWVSLGVSEVSTAPVFKHQDCLPSPWRVHETQHNASSFHDTLTGRAAEHQVRNDPTSCTCTMSCVWKNVQWVCRCRLNLQKRVCDERQRREVCFEWVRLLKAPISFYLLFIDLFIYDLRPNLLREWLQQTKASSLFLLEENVLLGYSAEVLHVFWLVKYLSFSQQAATNEFINFSSSAASRHNSTELLKKFCCCQSTFPQTEEPNLP